MGRASASHYLHVSWDFSKDVLFVLWWSLVFSALVVVGIHVGPKSWVRRVLESRVLVFFGTYSYGIYLVHQPLFYCLSQVLSRHFSSASQSFLVLGLGGGGMSTVFAVLSYRYFETPFLRLKQRFSPEHHRVSNMPAVSA